MSKGRKQDPELLAIGRVRRILDTLNAGQRMNVLRYVTEGEFTKQRDAQTQEKRVYASGAGYASGGVDYERGALTPA